MADAPLDTQYRDQLSNLRALLLLSMLMTESTDEDQILRLATTSVPSLAHCHIEGVYADGVWRVATTPCARAAVQARLELQLEALAGTGGALVIPDEPWAWAFPLRAAGFAGHFIVGAEREPTEVEQFLLRTLAQQTGVALANARLHARERASAEELRRTNTSLQETVRAYERVMEIHSRFNQVAVAGEGQPGIARALHALTGYSVAVEDRYGNLRAWAGPNQPDPYPKDPPARREQMLRRALREARPIREGGRLLAVAQPSADVLGVLALVDPGGRAGPQELVALEHAATILAMELSRLRSLAETELRLRRDLVEDLLAGTDEDSALARAQALGYDLERPHRVLVVEGRGRTRDEGAFFHAVRRAARDLDLGSLLVSRGGSVVVLAHHDHPWDKFRAAILSELGGGRCRLAVGGLCRRPGDFPRSSREAALALRLQHAARGPEGVTAYDELGVYRILCKLADTADVEALVREWLGTLLDYDERKGSDLVVTVTEYLECGGNWDDTAHALSVHRSTLKYRLQRIRDLTGYDLNDPDTHFNLQLATRAWRSLLAVRGEAPARPPGAARPARDATVVPLQRP